MSAFRSALADQRSLCRSVQFRLLAPAGLGPMRTFSRRVFKDWTLRHQSYPNCAEFGPHRGLLNEIREPGELARSLQVKVNVPHF